MPPRTRRTGTSGFEGLCAPETGLRLLCQLNRQLAFRLRHFAPEFAQIGLDRGVLGIFAEGDCEPAIRCGQVAGSAQSSGIECSHFDHGFGIRFIRLRLEQAHSSIAILGAAASVEILPGFGDSIVG